MGAACFGVSPICVSTTAACRCSGSSRDDSGRAIARGGVEVVRRGNCAGRMGESRLVMSDSALRGSNFCNTRARREQYMSTSCTNHSTAHCVHHVSLTVMVLSFFGALSTLDVVGGVTGVRRRHDSHTKCASTRGVRPRDTRYSAAAMWSLGVAIVFLRASGMALQQ